MGEDRFARLAAELRKLSDYHHCARPGKPANHAVGAALGEVANAVDNMLANREPDPVPPQFQDRVHDWMLECFGAEITGDRAERNRRFLEEALELVQANGCTAAEAHWLVDYVFGRPAGELRQEVGGVMVTLAALCNAAENGRGVDLFEEGETELDRVRGKISEIRRKQEAKPRLAPPRTVWKGGF